MKSFIVVIMVSMVLSACQPVKLTATNTQAPQPTITLTLTLQPSHTATDLPTQTSTPEPTLAPSPTATRLGGGTGILLQYDGWSLYALGSNGFPHKMIHDNCPVDDSISPNGKYLICSSFGERDGMRGGFGIVLIDLQKLSVVKEFLPETFATGLGWTPDGKQYLFRSSYQGKSGILSLEPDNQVVKIFYPTDKNIVDLQWSPDGKKMLLVEVIESENTNNYYVIDADGSDFIQVNDSPQGMNLSLYQWGSNSDTLLIPNYDQVISLDTLQPTGEKPTSRPWYYPEGSVLGIVAVSPDGNYEVAYDQTLKKTYLLDIQNEQLKDISEVDLDFQSGSFSTGFSPDGTQFAYFDNIRNTINLFKIDSLTGSVLIKVARDASNQYDFSSGSFLWLPDGKHIVYVQADGKGGFEINRVDLFGEVTPIATAKWPVRMTVLPMRP